MDFVLIGDGFSKGQVDATAARTDKQTTFTVDIDDNKITWGKKKKTYNIILSQFKDEDLKYGGENKTVTLGGYNFLEVDSNVLRNFYLLLYLIINKKVIKTYWGMYHIELNNIPLSNTDPSWGHQIYTYIKQVTEKYKTKVELAKWELGIAERSYGITHDRWWGRGPHVNPYQVLATTQDVESAEQNMAYMTKALKAAEESESDI
jgi:hypothetical protein